MMSPFRIAATFLIIVLQETGHAAIIAVNSGDSIQAAIYIAKPGDIIEVYSGVYYEHVNINKQLTLRGVGIPVLDATASGSAITLSADGVILEGFRTINSGQWPGEGAKEAGIKIISRNNTVMNNNASNNSNGIFIVGGGNNTITRNTANNNLGF
jgi:nitrous oxidase accessory protein